MRLIDIHTHTIFRGERVISVVNTPKSLVLPSAEFVSVGVHPWFIRENDVAKDLDSVRQMASQRQVLAIGECGLDKLKGADFELQKIVFKEQIEMAQNVKKPILIHCVKSYSEILALRKHFGKDNPWIIHGFRGGLGLANQLIGKGIKLSFGDSLLWSKKLQLVYKVLNVRDTFFETDESAKDIASIYELAAELKGCQMAELECAVFENFKALFNVEVEGRTLAF